jgi:hypothetical protein
MSHRGAPKKKNRHHYVAAGGEAASPPPLLVIAKHQAGLTQLPHVPLHSPAAQTQDSCQAVDRRPGTASSRVAVIKEAEIGRQDMQPDTGLSKTRNELFGLGYPVKFALCRHNNLPKGLRRCALVYNPPKRRAPGQEVVPPLFYAVFKVFTLANP